LEGQERAVPGIKWAGVGPRQGDSSPSIKDFEGEAIQANSDNTQLRIMHIM
jgi:hypothetical protein